MFNRTDPRTLTAEQRHEARARYGREFALDYGPCVVYVYATANGAIGAAGFRGKAIKPDWHFSFRTMDRLGAHADKWAAEVAASEAAKATRATARKAYRHTLRVGDVLKSSWGYDQTNVDWFEVVAVVWSTMVEIREIAADSQDDGATSMTGSCTPMPGHYVGAAKRCRVGEGNAVKVGHRSAHPAQCTAVGGVRIFQPAQWTAYA